MNIEITGRHDNSSQEVKDYAREKARKVLKYFNNITKVQVILDSEKDNHTAEMIISVSRGTQLVGQATHAEIHAAIDLLIDKMERQLVRFKERLKDRRGGKSDQPSGGGPSESDEDPSYDDIIRRDFGKAK